MAENSAIEWTDHTFNPWIGCQKVGPGCDHCYAETLMDTRYGRVNWGSGEPRVRTSAANWRKPLAWQRDAAAFLTEHGRRQRVFCASLADVFDNAVDPAWRRDLLGLISRCPDLDWLVLTKRIGNVRGMLTDAGYTALPAHVILGATVINQVEADRDVPKLLDAPAARRFLSMEPLLGPVDLTNIKPPDRMIGDAHGWSAIWTGNCIGRSVIDWVIVGGESGPGARPMHPDWARSLRDQCAAAGVPFLFKQWGEWAPFDGEQRRSDHMLALDGASVERVGKKAAGRLLDAVQHDGVPA